MGEDRIKVKGVLIQGTIKGGFVGTFILMGLSIFYIIYMDIKLFISRGNINLM